MGKAIETVEALHPGYLAEVGEFIRADPARPWREALDIARLASRAPSIWSLARRFFTT
jgi:hypothetical protein